MIFLIKNIFRIKRMGGIDAGSDIAMHARLFALLTATLSLGPAIANAAEPYPSKPIRFVVPFTPGGSQDVIARIVGQKLADRVGHQVVIDNRSGAAGLIATEVTAHAAPDGYTILMVTAGPITIAPSLQRKLPYDPLTDLAYVTHLVDTPMALIANPSIPAQSVTDVVALAKSRPGRINYASVGSGSISHLTMELFKTHTGTDMVHVPYKGATPAFIDLISGQVSLLFVTTASAQPYTSSGKARALAVASAKRSGMMPEVPTMSEAGIKGFEVPVWAGVAITAGTPGPIISKLHGEFAAIIQLPDVRERFAQLGSGPVGGGPEEFTALIKADGARWARVIKTANVKID